MTSNLLARQEHDVTSFLAQDSANADTYQTGPAGISTEVAWFTERFAIIYMISGILIALSGKRYAYVAGPVIGAVFVFESITLAAWAFGFLESIGTQLLVFLVSFPLGVITGESIRKYPRFGHLFSGFILGFIYGIVVYVVILAATEWCSASGMIGIGILLGIGGLLLAYYSRSKLVPTLSLSLIGSWIFIRSAALFFGGLPSESEIWKMIDKQEEVDFP